MLKIYGIKNCDSVKKALKFLQQREIPYTFIDFKTTPPTKALIEEWLQKCELKTLLNKRSTTYKNLKLKEMQLSEEESIEWLAKEPLLIKRPVICFENELLIGYNEALYEEKLPQTKG
jgi:Spx/MgsR family transcriptional regulator